MGRRITASLACVTALAATAASADAGASEARRLGFDGQFSADSANPYAGGMGGGMMPGMSMFAGLMQQQQSQQGAAGALPMMTPDQEKDSAEESSQFIGGMVKSFLNKQDLQPGELDCITKGSKSIGGNVGQVAGQLGMILQQAFDMNIPGVPDEEAGGSTPSAPIHHASDGAGSIEDMVNQISNEPQQKDAPPPPPSVSFGDDDPWGMSASDAHKETAAPTTHAPKAPADPSLAFFYNSGRRLQMLPGMMPPPQAAAGGGFGGPGGLMAAAPLAMKLGFNMKQIVSETRELVGECVHSDAKEAFHKAGQHMENLNYITGHFLANGADIVTEFADSVLAYQKHDPARFGSDVGVALRKVFLSNNADGSLPEGLPGDDELANVTAGMMRGFFGEGTKMNVNFKEDPSNPARIDMHACVGENLGFFQQIWASTMFLFAQKASGAHSDSKSGSNNMQFGTMLAFTMMELPGALDKCHISPEQKDMFLDSLKALGSGMHMKFSLPTEGVTKKKVMGDFAQTVKDWSAHRWFEFGHGLGNTMREATVAYFPQKYSISIDGTLLRELSAPSALRGAGGAGGAGGSFLLFVVPGMLLAAVVLRRGRAMASSREAYCSESDEFMSVE